MTSIYREQKRYVEAVLRRRGVAAHEREDGGTMNKRLRVNVIQGVMLVATCGCAAELDDKTDDPVFDAEQSWESFRASAYHEPFENGVFSVDGDTLIPDEDDLHRSHDAYMSPAGPTLTAAAASNGQAPQLSEYCGANSQERAIADATAMIIPKGEVIANGDGTYAIARSPFTYLPEDGVAICPDEPYYNHIRSNWGRTAFFVGGDLMVTAPHGPRTTYDPKDYAVVFGLRANGVTPKGTCIQPDLGRVPAANVYFPPSDSYLYHDAGTGSVPNDYLLFKLDRPVPGVTPLPLRRSGSPDVGDPLFAAGHPNRLPLKIGRGGYVRSTGPEGLDVGSLPAFVGNSGSPVFNPLSELVDTIVAGGGSNGLTWTYDPELMCYRTVPYFGNPIINNGSMAVFASHVPIPPTELQLSPTNTIVHTGPVGGPLTSPSTQFSIAPPPTATSTLTFRVSTPILLPPAPAFTVTPAPGEYSLAPGAAPLQFTVNAGPGAVTSCKVVNTSIGVLSLNHPGFSKRVRHRFEIGMSNFTVSPTDDWSVTELGAPYPTRTIEITNPYSEPAPVSVTPQAPWVRVNGAASATLNLAPAGSPGDHATVTLSFDDSATGFPLQSETKSVDVVIATPQHQCSLRQPEVIAVTLTRGIERFVGLNQTTDWLPGPAAGQTFGSPSDIVISIDEAAFNVDDIDVAVSFNDTAGAYMPASQADMFIKFELIAPNGVSSVLWDRNDAPANYLVFDASGSDPNALGFEAFKLDQSTTPPLGPGSLNAFNGLSGNGDWKLRLWTTDTTHRIQPHHVSLRITKKRQADLFAYNYVYDWLPAPNGGATFGAPVELSIDLSADAAFTVNDVNLDLGFYDDGGSGTYLGVQYVDELLKAELIGPDGTAATVWDRNNAPTSYLHSEVIDWFGGTGVSVLKLDDQVTPPLGPNNLAVFNGRAGNGLWRVRLRTADPGHRILWSHAKLSIGR
ncbi:serine protease [Sorangium sp. So ce136]|uniref:trypsin-like serine peptidase n=1 Tax=Sorangium sp. So ce136 TaxID=3133284 RepID=UPI003F0D7E81